MASVPGGAQRARRRGPEGRAAHPRGRVHRRVLQVRAGEIVALAGLVGAGRSEVARAVFGIDRYDAGRVAVRGRELRRASPTAAMAAGIGFVPEDRRQQGLVMDMSVQQNVALASLARLRQGGLVRVRGRDGRRRRLGGPARGQDGRLDRPRPPRCPAATSRRSCWPSGWAAIPALLIVDEPTRGIDIGHEGGGPPAARPSWPGEASRS